MDSADYTNFKVPISGPARNGSLGLETDYRRYNQLDKWKGNGADDVKAEHGRGEYVVPEVQKAKKRASHSHLSHKGLKIAH